MFGPRLCEWVAILLSKASSGHAQCEPGPSFWHRRGLRQVGPLSPILSVFMTNMLDRLLTKAMELACSSPLHPHWSRSTGTMQLSSAISMGILALFAASRLRTNFAQCSVSHIACVDNIQEAAAERQLAHYHIKYLGIPLAIRRLLSKALQPVVDGTANRLPT